MKLDVAAASAAAAAEPEVVYEASSLRWGSLKSYLALPMTLRPRVKISSPNCRYLGF